MHRIAVLGANGQVGTEVCLHLALMPDVHPVAISRTEFGASLLRRCGVECRVGTLDDPERARALLDGCDLVADFTLPNASAHEIRRIIRQILERTFEAAPGGAGFVYASTIMAFGMRGDDRRFRPRRVARTVYSASKRFGERRVRSLGRRSGRAVWILRLGEVHGVLQNASRRDLAAVSERPVRLPTAGSYTVFAYSVAEALAHIAQGREEPGRYTLVSTPEWSWAELHEYYCQLRGVEPRVVRVPADGGSWRRGAGPALRQMLGRLARHRELAIAHVLPWFPRLEERLRAGFYRRLAAGEIAARDRPEVRELPLQGPIPGRRLRSLSDSRSSMESRSRELRALLRRAVEAHN